MLYNNTILLTVSGLSYDFYWNMSDMDSSSKKESTKKLIDHDRDFFDSFISIYTYSS